MFANANEEMNIGETSEIHTEGTNYWVSLGLSLLTLSLVIFYLLSTKDTIDVVNETKKSIAQPVTIKTISVKPETVMVSTFAEVRPRWSAELKATISGRVLEVFDNALAGEHVMVDTSLITIENSQYIAELSAAELAFKKARLLLMRAEKATQVERKLYQQSKTSPPNDLALHLPELAIAESTVKSAKAHLKACRQRLNDSTIKAPFSAYVSARFVSPGQSVNPGDPLLKLVDDRQFELMAKVGSSDWKLLQQPLSGLIAKVLNQKGNFIADAVIRQGGGFLDEQTRQYTVFLEIDKYNSKKVLSGEFVKVQLPGISVPKALNIPETALTQEGFIWYVDKNDRLQRASPKVLFHQKERTIIRAPAGMDTLRIVSAPMAAFLPGQIVHPQELEN